MLTNRCLWYNLFRLAPRPLGVASAAPPGGCFIGEYLDAIVFIDGQNLYRSAKDAWRPQPAIGPSKYSWPSYDVETLATVLTSKTSGRTLSQIRFYTGVPRRDQNAQWHDFWKSKLGYLESQGIKVYRGKINVHQHEKGVDVKLSVDLIRLTYEKQYEVAIIVSQDRDFEPAIQLANEIARDQQRQLIFESHFPVGPGSHSNREIPNTRWMPIDKATYDACLDTQDY